MNHDNAHPTDPDSLLFVEAVRIIAEHVRATSAPIVLQQLAGAIADVLRADMVFIGRLMDDSPFLVQTLAQVVDGKSIEPFQYNLNNTPCEQVVKSGMRSYADRVVEVFPGAALLAEKGARGYVGIPLHNSSGDVSGLMAVLFRGRIERLKIVEQLLQVFATRASAELERMRLEKALEEEKDRYKRFFDEDLAGNYVTAPDGRLLDANPVFLRIFGFDSLDQARATDMSTLYQDTVERERFLQLLREHRKLENLESTNFRMDGTPIRIRENVIGDFDDRGNLIQLRGYLVDITEEYALTRELSATREIIEESPAVAFVWENEPGWPVSFVTENVASLCGYTAAELLNGIVTYADLIHPEDRDRVVEEVKRYSEDASCKSFRHERYRLICRDESIAWVDDRTVIQRSESGDVIGFRGVVLDVTEQQKTKVELAESRQRYLNLFKGAPDAIFLADAETGTIVDANPAAERLLKKDLEEIIGMHQSELHPREPLDRSRQDFSDHVEEAGQTGRTHLLRQQVVCADGSIVPVEIRADLIEIEGRQVLQGVFRDVSEREMAERKLLDSENQFRSLVEQAITGVYIIQDGVFTYVNPRLAEIFGYDSPDEIIDQKSVADLVFPPDRDLVLENIRKRVTGEISSVHYAFRGCRKDHSPVHVEVHGSSAELRGRPVVVGTLLDITERINAEEELAAREARYHSLVESSPDPIYVSRDRQLIVVNDAWVNMFGYSREEVLSDSFDIMRIVAPDCRDMVERRFAAPQSNKPEASRYELGVLTKDGRRLDMDVVAVGIEWEGKPAVQGIYRNITESRKRERELEENRLRLETTQRVARIGFLDWDLKTDRIYLSDTVIDMYGLEKDSQFTSPELVSKVVADEDKEAVGMALQEAIREGIPYDMDHRVKRPSDGVEIWVHSQAHLITNDEGQLVRLLGTTQDITERKQREREIQESRLRLETAQRAARLGFLEWDVVRNTVFLSEDIQQILGIEGPEGWRSVNLVQKIVHPLDREQVQQTLVRSLKKGEPFEMDYRIMRPIDQREIWVHGVATFHRGEDGRVVRAIGLAQDITDRKQAEEALRGSEEKFRVLAEFMPIGVMIYQEEYFVYANPAAEAISGYSQKELLSMHFWEMVHPDHQEMVRRRGLERLRGESSRHRYEFKIIRKDGEVRWIDFSGTLIQFEGRSAGIIVVLDITEQKQLEQERKDMEESLRQSQKLETVGTLAGGIAHDFNNILTPILGFAELAAMHIPVDSPAHEHVQRIEGAAKRAKDLVRQILMFSRRVEHEKKKLDLGPVVKEAMELLRASLPSSIEICTTVDPDVGNVLADSSQIFQMLMNLCTNAYQAIGDGGGVLEVSLSEQEFTAEELRNTSLKAGTYAVLRVRDTGSGMNQATVERVFEPFFTTKEVGKGTGLGLSVVHGVIKGHGGDVLINSAVGKGTTFSIFLPIADEKEGAAFESPTSPHAPLGGSERILVVDDEDIVRDLHYESLVFLGYSVDACRSGEEALSRFVNDPDGYALVLTDLTMPNMSGFELAKAIHKVRSDVPILMVTGYHEEFTEETKESSGIDGVVMKPYRLDDLDAAVRSCLNHQR